MWRDQGELRGNMASIALCRGNVGCIALCGGTVQILTRRVVFSDLLNHSLIQSFHSFDPNAVWTAFV